MIDELVANAKCGLRNISEWPNRDGAALIACTILIPQATTVFDRSALDQIEELGGEGTPAAGHLKCKRHERLDGRINPVCIGEAIPAFSSSSSTTMLCLRMTTVQACCTAWISDGDIKQEKTALGVESTSSQVLRMSLLERGNFIRVIRSSPERNLLPQRSPFTRYPDNHLRKLNTSRVSGNCDRGQIPNLQLDQIRIILRTLAKGSSMKDYEK